MKTYLVTLTPQEPYFFGNEKTFLFKGEENQGQRGNSYYIRSERTPLQSTLMGMMRYILMPFKDYSHLDENAPFIGSESYRIDAENQSFGVIRGLHPVFMLRDGEKYVVTPFDCKPKVESYTPFSCYREIETESGKKLVTPDYNPKEGLADSYMRLSDGALVPSEEIFGTETRVGNRKTTSGKEKDGFYKKEYSYLKDDYRFAFYAELDDSAVLPEDGKIHVFLGQGKSLFSVSFEERENTLEKEVESVLPQGTAYCLSDVFTDVGILDTCVFAVIQTRDYRAYITNAGRRITKGSVLYKLIKAGSVFVVSDKNRFAALTGNGHCQLAGYNRIILKEE